MINRERCAAVCIDIQEKLVPAMADKEILVENAIKLLKGLAVEEVPLIVTQQYTKGLGETIPSVKEAAEYALYLEKISYSAYSVLREHLIGPEKWPHIIIFGIESHICVLQTAMELKEAGYTPVLVTDCMSSRKQKDYDCAINRAMQEGIILTTYEALLFELDRTAGTDKAKAVQKIIK